MKLRLATVQHASWNSRDLPTACNRGGTGIRDDLIDRDVIWRSRSAEVSGSFIDMAEAEYVHVVTTVGSTDGAAALARSAVDARVAACAQVSGPIQSTYWWQGAVEEALEWVITFKATRAGYDALERHIRENHSYDTPEILALPILVGNPAYLAWVSAETR
jgi:periplasmic divalent cation tolerance protein